MHWGPLYVMQSFAAFGYSGYKVLRGHYIWVGDIGIIWASPVPVVFRLRLRFYVLTSWAYWVVDHAFHE